MTLVLPDLLVLFLTPIVSVLENAGIILHHAERHARQARDMRGLAYS